MPPAYADGINTGLLHRQGAFSYVEGTLKYADSKTLADAQKTADTEVGISKSFAIKLLVEDPYTGVPRPVTEINATVFREDGKEYRGLVLTFASLD